MTLTVNTSRTQISILSTLLNSFIASPASYTNIKVQMYFNSTSASTTETYSSTRLITSSTPVSTSGGLEYINPSFLSIKKVNSSGIDLFFVVLFTILLKINFGSAQTILLIIGILKRNIIVSS